MNKLNNNFFQRQEVEQDNNNFKHKIKLSNKNMTNNICYLPSLVLDNIIGRLPINTVLSFRSVNKIMYNYLLPKVVDIFCSKKNFNDKAFSRESYDNFIKNKLCNMDPKLLASIESYIDELDANSTDKYKNEVKFTKFLFYKMYHLKDIFPQTVARCKWLHLNETRKKIVYKDADYIMNFKLSTCGNYCLTTTTNSEITFYKVKDDFTMSKLNCIVLKQNKNLSSIEFTPENNLITLYDQKTDFDRYASREEYCKKFVILWKLEFTTNNIAVEKIAELQSLYKKYKKIIITFNDTLLVESVVDDNDDDSHPELNFYSVIDNTFVKTMSLNQLIERSDNLPINDFSISSNIKVLALSLGAHYGYKECQINIFFRNKLKENFREKAIRSNLNEDYFIVTGDLQLNSSGDICVFRNAFKLGATVLKRKNDFWYPSMFLNNFNCTNINILPYENNIMLVHSRFYPYNRSRIDYFKIIPLIKEKTDQITEDYNGKVIKHKSCLSYRWPYSIFPYYGRNKDCTYLIHPTGLAVITFHEGKQAIKVFFPKKVNFSDKINRFIEYCFY
jgi:hypothetical protein